MVTNMGLKRPRNATRTTKRPRQWTNGAKSMPMYLSKGGCPPLRILKGLPKNEKHSARRENFDINLLRTEVFIMGKHRIIPMAGKKFGKLTVLRDSCERSGSGAVLWVCECDCGEIKTIIGSSLRSGITSSCGCKRLEIIKSNVENLTGRVFDRWTVLERDYSAARSKNINWICRCECGTVKSVLSGNLKNGSSKSCGCLQVDSVKTHGMSASKEYQSWAAMKERCYRKAHVNYKNYGGRGISVCDLWLNSFESFYKDMGDRPRGKTLERKNNLKGYYPENCIWASKKEQARNRKGNVIMKINGKVFVLVELLEKFGIARQTWSYHRAKGLSNEGVLSYYMEKGGVI
jgi:hypothetical protein